MNPAAVVEQSPEAPRSRIRLGVLGWASLAFVVLLALTAVFAPWIAPHDPAAQSLGSSALPPDGTYWLGTDNLGRDITSRLIYGVRWAFLGPLAIAIGAGVLGTALGLLAGSAGGWIDNATMRVIDLVYAIPPLLLAIVVVGVFGGGYTLAVAVIIVLAAPGDVRLVRSAVLAQRDLPYVQAARVVGLGEPAIAVRHVLPNVAPTVVANVLLEFVGGLVALSGLAFLGLGLAAGSTDWGLMLSENRSILDLNPYAAIAPVALIMLTAVAVTILGDRVFDLLTERAGK
ncbi:ABC transporter permease [Amycolatopsis sp. NPDC098790]|uniref:ABC transporter permease n=1 Tax=Amycolatopsis sp. NPDC098790 TaxID=3363939 RepID=UPI00380AA7B8